MSVIAIILTVVFSVIFLGVIIVLVLNRRESGRERIDFDISRPASEEKKGFDFASKRQAHRKSFPGPWNQHR
ncbi:MAG: hypothetical protein E2P00_08530 [Acidobacteria bacterium]|nr:MAG: hypothetical protein E2P03_07750 [Acidobacteriota bacterium]TDI40224.1 MAG: hypothetical protein E2P00_08530 [Acidobacteriota bacterium]